MLLDDAVSVAVPEDENVDDAVLVAVELAVRVRVLLDDAESEALTEAESEPDCVGVLLRDPVPLHCGQSTTRVNSGPRSSK